MQSIYAVMMASAAIGGPNDLAQVGGDSIDSLNTCIVTKIEENDVPAIEAGILDVLEVTQGSLVSAGQLIGRVDDEDAKLAKQVAEYEKQTSEMLASDTIRIRAARAQHKVSSAEWEDAERANIREPNTFPLSEIRRRRFTAERDALLIEKEAEDKKMARIDVNAKEAQRMRAEALVARHLIKAPFDGEVTQVYKQAKEWVNPGDPVLRLVRMDRLRVAGFVPAKRFSRHEIMGRQVMVEVTTTGGAVERFSSQISYVSNEVTGGRFRVAADISNRQVNAGGNIDKKVWLLNPGLHASMKLQSGVAVRGSDTAKR